MPNAETRLEDVIRVMNECSAGINKARYNPAANEKIAGLAWELEVVIKKAGEANDTEVIPIMREFKAQVLRDTNYSDLMAELLMAKSSRAKALAGIDRELATAYMKFDYDIYMLSRNLKEGDSVPIAEVAYRLGCHGSVHAFINKDNELYAQIVRRFAVEQVKEGTAEHAAPVQAEIAPPAAASVQAGTSAGTTQTLQKALENAITHKINGNTTEDSLLRIRYFVQDAAEALSPEQMLGYGEAFGRFHLAGKFRNRDTRPSDIKIRNFFDDVTMRYLRHKRVPEASDLEALYRCA